MTPNLPSNEIRVLPDIPFFVVTKTTPFAPRAPYSAVDAASFKTDILWISFGFSVASGLSFCAGTPSITTSAFDVF
ncbi:hypothetical protein D3C81_1258660 [compost metagenome]